MFQHNNLKQTYMTTGQPPQEKIKVLELQDQTLKGLSAGGSLTIY